MYKNNLSVIVSCPTQPKAKKLTQEDVGGTHDPKAHQSLSAGLVITRHGQTCPIFHDVVPLKTVTVTCKPDEVREVVYWLEFVHGGNSVPKIHKKATWKGTDGQGALRSDYQCS